MTVAAIDDNGHRQPGHGTHRPRKTEKGMNQTRRIAGGLTVGTGARTDATSRIATRAAMARPADADEMARMRPVTTIVPIAKATPMQRAATTTLASVSLPSFSV